MSTKPGPIVVGVDGTPEEVVVLGSTSMHCVRHAHAPIVVIPVDDREYAEPVR